ncbi:MalY/PatB family protein [Vibrio comitans]
MKYNFSTAAIRKDTYSGKWAAMTSWSSYANDETLPFWVADMEFEVAPEIIKGMKAEIDRLTFGYSVPTAEYYDKTQAWLKRRYDWTINSDDIRVASGTINGISTLIKITTNAGHGIIIQSPVYHKFAELVTKYDRIVVDNPLKEENGKYDMDFEQLEMLASDPNTTMMLLCSPHNPIGRVWTTEELAKVVDICGRNNVLLVSDEIHSDLTRVGITHIPTAKAISNPSHVITLNGTGKTFNLGGMHISHTIFSNAKLKAKWDTEIGLALPNPVSMAAVEAAYTQCDQWVDELRQTIDGNLEFARAYLAECLPQVKMQMPEATYFAWLDFRGFELSDEKLDEIMIQEANILLEGGAVFGAGGSGWQRLNLACTKSMLEVGLERMCKAFSKYE